MSTNKLKAVARRAVAGLIQTSIDQGGLGNLQEAYSLTDEETLQLQKEMEIIQRRVDPNYLSEWN